MSAKRRKPLASSRLSRSPRRVRVAHIAVQSRHPPITVADLALRLELDLLLGHREDFVRRLQKALDAAASQT